MCNAAIAEGHQLDEFPALPTTVTHEQRSPIDITDAANQLVDEQVATCNANFLEFWKQTLATTNCASTPTYSSIAANAAAPSTRFATPNTTLRPQHKTAATHRQGQPPVPAPPREDLRVLVSLEADAPARNHIGYAIRAHVASKTGLELNRIPQVFQVNTGWAIRATDKLTRDLLVERQAELADDLGATAVETSQKWYTYAVDNCPRRLTDLYGNELNYDAAVRDEINNQTGLTPVSIRVPRRDNEQLPYKTLIISFLEPTKRPWSLFGTSRLARHIERTNPPRQCENCWDYHTRHACNRQTRCKRCGKTNHATHGSIHVRWIPGHTDIQGNEQADSLAKAGCALPEPPEAKPTLAYIRRVAKKQAKEAFQAWWQEHMPEKYKELKLKATTGCPKELSIPRPALHHIYEAPTETLQTTTKDSTMWARASPARAAGAKPQTISSIAGRSVHGTG
ncbi:hypothetical protein H633G_09933 [Metarhizium anisopliae BRIP 53284]|nr:hypothetical protein H633G_09933 [Metarhizium anisopliae BRIP 53284]